MDTIQSKNQLNSTRLFAFLVLFYHNVGIPILIPGGPLRFPNSLLLWLTADQDVLDKRISDRVDEMIDKGLVNEIKTFYENHVKESSDAIFSSENVDVTTKQSEKDVSHNTNDLNRNDVKTTRETDVITSGINYTSIDVTESESDVIESGAGVSLSERCVRKRTSSTTTGQTSISDSTAKITSAIDNDRNHHEGPSSKRRKVACDENSLLKSYEEGIFQAIGFKEFHMFLTYPGQCDKTKNELLQKSMTTLKQITTRYSKKQVRWVLNRIVNRTPGNNSLPVYNLDATDVEAWDLNVLEKAKLIVESFLKDEAILAKPYESTKAYVSNGMDKVNTGQIDGLRDEHIGIVSLFFYIWDETLR